MYCVEWKDINGNVCAEIFDDLTLAMNHSKDLGLFVCITGGEYDIVGMFGTNSVDNGLLPNGLKYTWRKRR